MWKSNFGRPTPWTRCCLRSCVCSMASDNLSHWLISTQVRVFLLCVTGKKKQLRVVRVEPRNGRRVLINGYAIAHLGGVAFDSVARHHDVIEIQSDDESEEDVDVKPDPEPPAKRQRAAPPGRVKRERP